MVNEVARIVSDSFLLLRTLLQLNCVHNHYNDSVLDLVFCSDRNRIVDDDALLPCDINHPASFVQVTVREVHNIMTHIHYFYNYKNADFQSFTSLVNWDLVFSDCNIEVCVTSFYKILSLLKCMTQNEYAEILNFHNGSLVILRLPFAKKSSRTKHIKLILRRQIIKCFDG